jgi:AbiV family abortive infection protein
MTTGTKRVDQRSWFRRFLASSSRPTEEPQRRTLTADSWQELEEKINSNPTLENAFRLMRDADLLFKNKRHASVVALAVLSLEEIGKYLLVRWSSDDSKFNYDRRRLHKMKQGAIAALFMVDAVRKEYKAQEVNFSDLGTPDKMGIFVRAVKTGMDKETRFAANVRTKVIEAVKWSGMYYDEERAANGIEPSTITADNAAEIMRLCSRAFMVLADEGNIILAKHFFPVLFDFSPSPA